MFKDVYKGILGEKAAQYQTMGFLISSACAEVIADVLLCPWEAVSLASFLFMIESVVSIKLLMSCLLIMFLCTVESAYANVR